MYFMAKMLDGICKMIHIAMCPLILQYLTGAVIRGVLIRDINELELITTYTTEVKADHQKTCNCCTWFLNTTQVRSKVLLDTA